MILSPPPSNYTSNECDSPIILSIIPSSNNDVKLKPDQMKKTRVVPTGNQLRNPHTNLKKLVFQKKYNYNESKYC